MPCAYLQWNNAILQYLARNAHADRRLYLTITPAILNAIFTEHASDLPAAEDATESLVGAVREVYANVVVPAGSLRALLMRTKAGEPVAGAFLAASVVAAYDMHTDDETSALAYYRRLASRLDVQLDGPYPVLFEPEAFEALWYHVALWLSEQKIGELALPASGIGRNRFIAYPLTHVPLRCIDTARLPQFFSWAGYEQGANVPGAHLESAFTRWSDIYRLSKPGREALGDGRHDAVLAQISLELRAWDGCVEEANGARIAPVELHLDIVRNRPVLSYVGRKPQGFPAEFRGGGLTLLAGEEGWYEPVRVPREHGAVLLEGIRWESAGIGGFVLQRHARVVIPFAPMEFATGFISRRRLPIGTPCAVLVAESHLGMLMNFMNGIASTPPVAARHPELPDGWVLLRNVHVIRDEQPPESLADLEIDHDLQIVARGGLRIGRRWQWLRGAPPQLIVVGAEAHDARVDGDQVPVFEGMVHTDTLQRVGIHVVEVPGLRQRVEIVDPDVSALCVDITSSDALRLVALPVGMWTLVGSDRRAVTTRAVRAPGAVLQTAFNSVWALSSATERHVKIVFLGGNFDAPAPIDRRSPSTAGLAWANAIYAANARRHQFGAIEAVPCEPVVDLWKRYVIAAKELKRRARRSRR